jgi:hypothetical protein
MRTGRESDIRGACPRTAGGPNTHLSLLRVVSLLGIAAVLLTIAAGCSAPSSEISFRDLYALGKPDLLSGIGFGVSPSGAAIAPDRSAVGSGPADVLGSVNHAILWTRRGRPIDLNPRNFGASVGTAIAGGQEVGWGSGTATGNAEHALLWRDAAASAIDLNPPGFASSFALATDGARQVGYGNGEGPQCAPHALFWSGVHTSVVDLNPAGFAYSQAMGIGGGQQVGWALSDRDGAEHAIAWSGSARSAIDLHPAGFRDSQAVATDGLSQVGYATTEAANQEHAI